MRAAIAAEVLKLRTVRTPLLVLAAAEFVIVGGTSGLVSSADSLDGKLPTAVGHVGLAALCTLVLGIVMMAGEYRHRSIADTFASFPSRTPVLGAKLLVAAVAGLAIGLIAAVTAIGMAWFWWQVKGADFVMSAEVWQTLLGGIVWNLAFAMLGVGVGALVRNLAGAIAFALVWIALIETIVGQLVGSEAARWLPFAAGQSLGRLDMAGTPLPQAAGAAVLAGYVVVASVAARLATLTRDVT